MKRLFYMFLIIATFITYPATIFANPPYNQMITVKVDGEIVKFPDAKPYIDNYRTMVPIKFVSKALGYNVLWSANKRQVTIANNDTTVVLKIDSINATVNERSISLDVAPKILNNRTFVPLRLVSEIFGCIVNWDESNYTINITTPYYYVEDFYYFNDIKIPVQGGDAISNDSTGRLLIRPSKFRIKEVIDKSSLIKCTIRKDVLPEIYDTEIKDFKELLSENNFSKTDIEYLMN